MNIKWKRKNKYIASAFLVATLLNVAPNAEAKMAKSCGSPTIVGSRTLQNIICKDGAPNKLAAQFLSQETPKMMKLKKNSTMHSIYQAICADWKHSTGPDLMNTYDYLVALNDWKASRYQDVYSNYPDCDKY
jgi:hypothetical protein